MSKDNEQVNDIAGSQKILDAKKILLELGFPSPQHNTRSALSLLSLLNIRPESNWADAENPLRGITPMMEFFKKYYNIEYAPNTRESVRRQTIHQFLQANLIVQNPDSPYRPTNSGKYVYQITSEALNLLKTYGSEKWEENLMLYRKNPNMFSEKPNVDGEMMSVIVDNQQLNLTPGPHNLLIIKIIRDFIPNFTLDGIVAYVGDTGKKFAYFKEDIFSDLKITINPHGKFPDVIILDKRNWLFLIEAVTSHGPINLKRKAELKPIFSGSNAGIIYVTAFLDRKSMVKYLPEISWKTEVWIADSPKNMIHFDGEKFLGPYEDTF